MSSKEQKNILVIIDGNAIIHRSYHALPPLTTKEGKMVNAVYGFASTLLKVMKDLKPTHMAVTFDMAGGTFRDELYIDYKATRVKADQELYDQIPFVHELVEAFGIPIYEKKGYEADDVIGTIVQKANSQKPIAKRIIVTGDMDTLQLIDQHTEVYTLRKGLSDVVVYDAQKAQERFGITPEQLIDYKALRGDPSDNIPGVSGIGEKTATELLKKFNTLDTLYQAVEDGSVADYFSASVVKKLKEGKEQAYLSQKLATIFRDVPIDFHLSDCVVQPFRMDAILPVFQKFEFTSLLKRIPGGITTVAASEVKKSKKVAHTLVVPENKKQLMSALVPFQKEKSIALRVVGTDHSFFVRGLFAIVLARAGAETLYLDPKKISFTKELNALFTDPEKEIVGYDLKRDIQVLQQYGIFAQTRLFDCMIASYLLSPDSRAHSLESIVLKELGSALSSASSQTSLFGMDRKGIVEEAEIVLPLADILKQELKEKGLLQVYQTIEEPVISVLAKMEMRGVKIDVLFLQELSKKVQKEIDGLTQNIYIMAGEEFNISSSQQLRDILFEKLDIPTWNIKKGKTGLSTAASELEKMMDLHPIIPLIQEYREYTKLQSTYIDALPKLMDPRDGRVHGTFNQIGAATGRLSSSDPNLQNIPIRTEQGREIRKAFIAEKGFVLLSADYSQIELRIAAHVAHDPVLIGIFQRGEDVHRSTAAKIHGIPIEQVTDEIRRTAKEVNFGVLYGMGTFGLASRTGLTVEEAREFIEKYFQAFKGLKEYLEQTKVMARKTGYVETMFGRRRYIPEINSSNFQLRAAAERMAINMPIQGAATGDLMKMAMKKVEDMLDPHLAQMVLQVHDELVFEVKKGHEKKIGSEIKEYMENVVQLSVPIVVDLKVGDTWGEMKKI